MTDKTQPTDAVAQPATDRETHFYLAGWNGARKEVEANAHFRQALQAAPPAPQGLITQQVEDALLDAGLPADMREEIMTDVTAPADVAVPQALRELIEAIEFTPLGVRAILAMTRARAALAAAPAQALAVAVPDGFGTAEHWKEKAEYWAGVAHRLRGEALRGEPVDGIVHPAQEHATQLAGQGQEPSPPLAVTGPVEWPATCDGLEQEAWEAWARVQRFDMSEHPMHYLFLNERTDAARQGWKGGLVYAVEQMKQRVHVVEAAPAQAQEDARDAGRWRHFSARGVFPKNVWNNGNGHWQYGEIRALTAEGVADAAIAARAAQGGA